MRHVVRITSHVHWLTVSMYFALSTQYEAQPTADWPQGTCPTDKPTLLISLRSCRYRDAEEPQLPGHSVTVRPNEADMKKLYHDAEETWTPAFVKLIKVRSHLHWV